MPPPTVRRLSVGEKLSDAFSLIKTIAAFTIPPTAIMFYRDYHIHKSVCKNDEELWPGTMEIPLQKFRAETQRINMNGAVYFSKPEHYYKQWTPWYPKNGEVFEARRQVDYPEWLQLANGRWVNRTDVGIQTIDQVDDEGNVLPEPNQEIGLWKDSGREKRLYHHGWKQQPRTDPIYIPGRPGEPRKPWFS